LKLLKKKKKKKRRHVIRGDSPRPY